MLNNFGTEGRTPRECRGRETVGIRRLVAGPHAGWPCGLGVFELSRARVTQEPSLLLKEIAAEVGISSSYVTRLLRLAFLAPDIVTAILNGRQSPQLTANRLMDDTTRLPLDWTAQRELL